MKIQRLVAVGSAAAEIKRSGRTRSVALFQRSLMAAFLTSIAAILFRAVANPRPAKAIVNLESAAAVAFLGCLCISSTGAEPQATPRRTAAIFLPLLAVVPFLITLRAPLLFDSYWHLVTASTESFRTAIYSPYLRPATRDLRPLGYVDYWLEYKWAGFSSLLWHLDGLLLHLAAIYLLFRSVQAIAAIDLGVFAGGSFVWPPWVESRSSFLDSIKIRRIGDRLCVTHAHSALQIYRP
jgi:hypothetical protein